MSQNLFCGTGSVNQSSYQTLISHPPSGEISMSFRPICHNLAEQPFSAYTLGALPLASLLNPFKPS